VSTSAQVDGSVSVSVSVSVVVERRISLSFETTDG